MPPSRRICNWPFGSPRRSSTRNKCSGLCAGLTLAPGLDRRPSGIRCIRSWRTATPSSAPRLWSGLGTTSIRARVPRRRSRFAGFRSRAPDSTGFNTRCRGSVPSEADAQGSEAKAEARRAALAEGKLTPEEFDIAFRDTPKTFYRQLESDFKTAGENLEALDSVCQEKFGRRSAWLSGTQDERSKRFRLRPAFS